MKIAMLLTCIFFIPASLFAQKDTYPDIFLKPYSDSTLYKRVILPELKRGGLDAYFEIGMRSEYGYTISTDSMYRKIFSAFSRDSLPAIDFSKEALLVHIYCPQCLATCRHSGSNNEPCHRNACMYRHAWFVTGKK